jgi:hypothetical protein
MLVFILQNAQKQDETWRSQIALNPNDASVIEKYLCPILSVHTHPIGKIMNGFVVTFTTNYKHLTPESAAIALPKAQQDIFSLLEKMLETLFKRYSELASTDISKEATYYSLEYVLFPKIYSILFLMYKAKYREKDYIFDAKFNELRDIHPKHVGLKDRFWLEPQLQYNSEILNHLTPEGPQYQKAIFLLQKIANEKCPAEKVKILILSQQEICNCIAVFWGDKIAKDKLLVGADDLVALLAYCIIKSNIQNLASEIAFIEDNLTEDSLKRGEGYALATIQQASEYVLSLQWDILIKDV